VMMSSSQGALEECDVAIQYFNKSGLPRRFAPRNDVNGY
jgi:hypothetical protein